MSLNEITANWRRKVALKLSRTDKKTSEIGNELLADIKQVFEMTLRDRISTVDLISELCADDESPWATYNRGKPITTRQVACQLAVYGIASKTVRIGFSTPKGFELSQFSDAFARYLATLSNTPDDPELMKGTTNDLSHSEELQRSGCSDPAQDNSRQDSSRRIPRKVVGGAATSV